MSEVTQAISMLNNRYENRGTAYTHEERAAMGILGRLPPGVETLEQQVDRCIQQLNALDKPINQYQLLANIQNTNTTLFYAIIKRSPERILPIIYTPTVGEACLKFGSLYQREHGVYVASAFKGRVREVLQTCNYARVDVMVITDGSRILGLGDLGANGMGISKGKISLYVAGAGLNPRYVLPIMIDVGTDNVALRNDPLYLGQRIPRVGDDEFYALMDEFMEAVKGLWPTAVVQFEDFSNNHCFDMLERYQKKYRCFNDDIQGTGAVISAGFVNAIGLSGTPVSAQRVLVFGAGSAAVGVARSIAALISLEQGVPEDKVRESFYLVDTKGLVTTTRGDTLAAHKVALARTDVKAEDNAGLKDLLSVIKYVRPTALLGLGGVGPVFTQEMVEFMASYCKRPIIFPLSNPTSKSEIDPADAYRWTNGAAIVASGSPYPETTLGGRLLKPSQGNNMYIFPGVGLGCSIAQPRYIPDSVLVAAAKRLHDLAAAAKWAADNEPLYPPITEIRTVSQHIATAVILQCQKDGVGGEGLSTNYDEVFALVGRTMWEPVYK